MNVGEEALLRSAGVWWEAMCAHRLRAPPLAYGYRQKWAAAHWWARTPPLAHGIVEIQNRAAASSALAKYRNLPQLYKPSQTLSNHIKPSQTSLP